MKKCAAGLAALFLIVIFLSPRAVAAVYELPERTSITAQSAYFVNLDTGIVVFEQNADEQRSVASLTKLMTALLLMENVSDLESTMIEANRDLYTGAIIAPTVRASHADIRPGEHVSAPEHAVRDDAAKRQRGRRGRGVLPGQRQPEQLLRADERPRAALGCTNTNFTSTNGLVDMDEGNYSSAHDIALITQECWKHEVFRTVVGTAAHQMPAAESHNEPYNILSLNAMIKPSSTVYRSYIKGVKTGSTHDAGRNFASAAVNDKGETYIGVVLGAPWDAAEDGYAYSFHDTATIYDWLFANYSIKPSIDTGSPVTEVKVNYSSEADTLMLYPAGDLKTVLPNDSDELLEKTFDVPESVDAPIAMGDKVGTVTLTLNGALVGTVDLIAGQDVARNGFLYAVSRVQAFFGGLYFRVVCILTAIFLVGYGLLTFWMYNRQKRQRVRRAGGPGNAPRAPRPGRPPSAGRGVPPPAGKPSSSRPPSSGPDELDLGFLEDDFTFGPPGED
jgi:D-alanyl-D-alanine carboxypeptidase (penicillin-binding protein 5/6)